MFDFHTHILPQMDDGSKNAQESEAMLRNTLCSEVEGVAFTPHFYAHEQSPDDFIRARQIALELLSASLQMKMPTVRMGAEVYYYQGIHCSDEILKLRMEGSRVLLVEMPFMPWTRHMVQSVIELNRRQDIIVLLAHIERYLPCQSAAVWDAFRENGVLAQSNADFFLQSKTKRRALEMLRRGEIQVLGSDCHNLSDRAPNLAQALCIIRQELGANFLADMKAQEEWLLNE